MMTDARSSGRHSPWATHVMVVHWWTEATDVWDCISCLPDAPLIVRQSWQENLSIQHHEHLQNMALIYINLSINICINVSERADRKEFECGIQEQVLFCLTGW